MERLSRRSFMKIAGAATGAAALAAAPPIARAAIGEEGAEDRSDDRRARGAARRVRARRAARRGDRHLRHRRAHVPRPRTRAAAAARGRQEGSELDVLPPRSSVDQPGPGRRQRRHLRVRQPGRPDDGHDHHELRARCRGRPAGRTSSSSATTSSTRSTSTTTGTRCRRSRTSSGSTRRYQNQDTFLYNTGPIGSLDRPELEQAPALLGLGRSTRTSKGKQQDHSHDGKGKVLGNNLACPPCNIGPRSTPNYDDLAAAAVHSPAVRRDGVRGSAERRLLRRPRRDLRPRRHQGAQQPPPDPDADGDERRPAEDAEHPRDRDQGADLDADEGRLGPERPVEAPSPCSASGAARAGARCTSQDKHKKLKSGPWTQVSRLGNPLFNEVIVPVGDKDRVERGRPDRRQGLREVREAAGAREAPAGPLPRRVPEPRRVHEGPGGPPRDPAHRASRPASSPGSRTSPTTKPSDMLRLNVAIPPTTSNPNALGLVGGDAAGYPNGRRVFDDVVSIELKAVAGATIPLVDPSFTPDAAVGAVSSYLTPGTTATSRRSRTSARLTTDTTRPRRDPRTTITPRTSGPST